MTINFHLTFSHSRFMLLAMTALAVSATASAKPRSDGQMRQAAISLFCSYRNMFRSEAASAAPPTVREITRSEGYVIYARDGGGFAVIATDDVAPEVLGYSDTQASASTTNMNFRWWLDAVNDVVKSAAKSNTTIKRITKPDGSKFDTQVATLCTSRWGQEEPYWGMCPTTSRGTCLTGCVATSMSQVLYYHKGPEHGVGTRTIYYPANNTSGTPVTANFADDVYDWDNMIDIYTTGNYTQQQADAVALLMKDCGVATNMDYAPDGSGAYHDQTADGLRRYFGLEDATYVERRNYSEKEWMEMIYDQVSRRLPIIYGGDDWQGGHSFVLDGYDSEGRVHINWGWEGSEDGYYDIALLNPSGYQFSRNQDAVINITPDPAVKMVSDTVTVDKEGSLLSEIDAEDMLRYDTLRVVGRINGTDLKVLRKMANRDEFGEETGGTMRVLDLKDATIVAGGEVFLNDAGKQLTVSEDNAIPRKAFYGCSLRQILLSDGIKSVGTAAFANCSRLDSVLLRPSADADFILKDDIIYSTDGKTITGSLPRLNADLKLMGDVTAIGDYAFSSRTRIKKLTLGSQLESIGKEAFALCSSINEIRIVSKAPIAISGESAFRGIDKKNCKLYVRAGSMDKFKSASQWGEFSNIIEYGTTIKARNAMREYGEENPRMGYSISGDHVDGVPEVTCDATPTTPAGRYPIHIKPGTITDESVDYEEGFLIITKAPLSVGVEDAAREMYEENPEFTLTYSGFKNDETAEVFRVLPIASCEADRMSPIGTYPITVSGGEADNYELSYTAGVLTVNVSTAISEIGNATGNATVNVYTTSGTLVASGEKNLNSLPGGVYIVEKSDRQNKSFHKIIIR